MGDRFLANGLDSLSEIVASIGRRTPAFFLDFDGTLTPLESRPDMVVLAQETREVLAALALNHVVCIVSGRGLLDLRAKVDLPMLYYAADHGHRVFGPPGTGIDFEIGPEERGDLEAAAYALDERLRRVEGAIVETKGVSLSVHYRLVPEADRPFVHRILRDIMPALPGFRLTSGKLVHEIVPDSNWNKGQAVMWLLQRLRSNRKDTCPVCVGDDRTDEDMFVAVEGWGVTLVVDDTHTDTRAAYVLCDHAEVRTFLQTFVTPRGDTTRTPR